MENGESVECESCVVETFLSIRIFVFFLSITRKVRYNKIINDTSRRYLARAYRAG